MIDIDLFKNINDTHGHPVGDLVLRDLAERMRTQVRAGELLARVGGEEFAWLMPETELDGARVAAERMRAEVAAEPIAPVGDVTVSAGISRLAPGESPDDFLNRADIALYAAKRGGRDMVVAHGDRAHG
jgi:diguanylate cyclase (GGDEF)-like protein